jgi:hypothetical protein
MFTLRGKPAPRIAHLQLARALLLLVDTMTHPRKSRPSVLLVGSKQALFAPMLRSSGFDVVRTNSRPAAIVYGNKLLPDFVLTDERTARVLCGCFPDGPFWHRVRVGDDLIALHGCEADAEQLTRFARAIHNANLAA